MAFFKSFGKTLVECLELDPVSFSHLFYEITDTFIFRLIVARLKKRKGEELTKEEVGLNKDYPEQYTDKELAEKREIERALYWQNMAVQEARKRNK